MTDEQLARAPRLWQQGINTFSISKIFRVPESDIYNRIEQIKNTPTQKVEKLVR